MPVGVGFIPARIGENKKMTEHKKLQPEIRFAGFTDDWEQRKLGDVVEIIGGGTPDTNNTAYWNGNIDWYSPTEIGNKPYVSGSLKKISVLGLQKSSAKILPANKTILFTSRAGIGDMAILTKQGTTNQGFQSFILKNYVDIYFLYSMGFKIKDFALKNASGSTFLEISKSQLSQMKLYLPSLKEQTQIGNFFKQLDDTIALHQRTLEKYQKLKISYLEKMFPKENELYPELRFPNFTDTWEQRKLEEFSKTTIGEFVIKTKQNPNSKYPVYNGGVSYTGFYDDFNNNGHKIIVSARGANAGFINIINGKYWAGNSCYSIDIQDNYCIEYVYHFMKHKQHLFTDFQQAANIPSVSKKDVEEFLISYPKSKEEQTQIGNFFKQLDDTIDLHQREVEKYKKIKQSYLEKMFI